MGKTVNCERFAGKGPTQLEQEKTPNKPTDFLMPRYWLYLHFGTCGTFNTLLFISLGFNKFLGEITSSNLIQALFF